MTIHRRRFLSWVGSGLAGYAVRGSESGAEAHGVWPPVGVFDDEAYWAQVRAQYPLTKDRVYLNTGGLGPAPYAVIDAVQQTMMDLQRISEHGHRRLDQARVPVAAFFGVKPAEIAFMRNATEANATVASGLTFLQQGDEVIFETHAHPGGAIPWMSRQKQQGIVVKAFEPDPYDQAENLNRIESLITPRTRVIQVSHLTAPTGIVMPVKRIATLARDRGLWFHIDGAQSAGAFPFDLNEIGCDSYGTSGHKWMGATHGTGLLYVKQERLDEVMPTEVGSYSDNGVFDIPDALEYNETAVRYECGTRDATTVVGMQAAVTFLNQIGMNRVAAYGKSLATDLHQRLQEIEGVSVLTPEDPAMRAGLTTFHTEGIPCREMYQHLAGEYKLRCRIVTERGLDAIRVSMHIFNNKAECDRVVEAVKLIVSKKG
ncbi:MAG: aminotransferase class V-fold PLP-dependent enzyme [Rhodothermales bacterium]